MFLQGLLANMVDTAFNQAFGQSLPILSDQKIVTNAHFTPNAGTTFFNVQPFILLPVPEPSSIVLAITAGVGMLMLGWRRAEPKVAEVDESPSATGRSRPDFCSSTSARAGQELASHGTLSGRHGP